jgi:hypothetical protein
MIEVKIRRIMLPTEHDNQKWLVLEGYVDGVPAVTKRSSIAMSAYVSRPEILEQTRAKLLADVGEYHANYLALQALG